jgi:hypothetical protein
VVHERLTSVKHKGKHPVEFIQDLVRSKVVKFKPLPGALPRLYDFQFEPRSLSVMHFVELSRIDRVAWFAGGGSNFDNLSASAEFTAAELAGYVSEVVQALRVLLVYCCEYCSSGVAELVATLVAFVEGTLMQPTWGKTELPGLVYWVNVLKDVRSAAKNGSPSIATVCTRCSSDDPLLRDLLYEKLHRQIAQLQQNRRPVMPAVRHTNSFETVRASNTQDGKNKFGRG